MYAFLKKFCKVINCCLINCPTKGHLFVHCPNSISFVFYNMAQQFCKVINCCLINCPSKGHLFLHCPKSISFFALSYKYLYFITWLSYYEACYKVQMKYC